MTTTSLAIERYREAVNQLDRAAYQAAFADTVLLMDPYGGRVLEGRAGLDKFFDGMERTWASFSMSYGEMYGSGDRVAVNWQVEAVAKNGKAAKFAGINVFTVTNDGLITQLEGYWDARAMMAQLK